MADAPVLPPEEPPGPDPDRRSWPARLARWTAAAAALAGLGFGAAWWAGWLPHRPAEQPPPPAEEPTGLACLGLVDAEGGVSGLSPAQPGVVLAVPVRAGDRVKAGDVLVQLDESPFKARLAEAAAALTAATIGLEQAADEAKTRDSVLAQLQAAVEAAEARTAAARAAARHRAELQKANAASAAEVAAAEAQVREAEAAERGQRAKAAEATGRDPDLAVRRARAEVAVAKARVEQATAAVREAVLTAPSAGVVLRVSAAPGDTAGGPGRPPAVEFAADGPVVVRAEVDQEFAPRVAVGRAAVVTDDTDPRRTWTGRVTRVGGWFSPRRVAAGAASSPSTTLALECVVTLDPHPDPPRINLRVRVRVAGPAGGK